MNFQRSGVEEEAGEVCGKCPFLIELLCQLSLSPRELHKPGYRESVGKLVVGIYISMLLFFPLGMKVTVMLYATKPSPPAYYIIYITCCPIIL